MIYLPLSWWYLWASCEILQLQYKQGGKKSAGWRNARGVTASPSEHETSLQFSHEVCVYMSECYSQEALKPDSMLGVNCVFFPCMKLLKIQLGA